MSQDSAGRRLEERPLPGRDPSFARLLETEARLRRIVEEGQAEARRIVEEAREAVLERERGAEHELEEAEAILRERVHREVERERRERLVVAVERVRSWRRARRDLVPELARWVAARILEESEP